MEEQLPALFFVNLPPATDPPQGHYLKLIASLRKKAYVLKGGRLSIQAAQAFLLGVGQAYREAYCISQLEPDDAIFQEYPHLANVEGFNVLQFVDLEEAIITALPPSTPTESEGKC